MLNYSLTVFFSILFLELNIGKSEGGKNEADNHISSDRLQNTLMNLEFMQQWFEARDANFIVETEQIEALRLLGNVYRVTTKEEMDSPYDLRGFIMSVTKDRLDAEEWVLKTPQSFLITWNAKNMLGWGWMMAKEEVYKKHAEHWLEHSPRQKQAYETSGYMTPFLTMGKTISRTECTSYAGPSLMDFKFHKNVVKLKDFYHCVDAKPLC